MLDHPHLRLFDCAPMAPIFPRWRVSTPCLVVEADCGLVLVDTGLGVHDHVSPGPMVRTFSALLGIVRDEASTVLHQLARMGLEPSDVADIVLTHLHFDHAGGLPDFPEARIHVHRRELDAMLGHRGLMSRAYDPADFAHGPRWVPHNTVTETWYGFEAIRLPLGIEMLLIPLFGHTRGLCGVAIRDGDRWLLQASDALPIGAQPDVTPPWLNRLVLGPHVASLAALPAAHPEVRTLAGHMLHPS